MSRDALRMGAMMTVLALLSGAGATARESVEFAERVAAEHASHLDDVQRARLVQLLTTLPNATRNIGTEAPEAVMGPRGSAHPISRAACRAQVLEPGLIAANVAHERLCGARWMAPIAPAPGADPARASVCIDRFEFPNVPCEYPLVWVSSSQASQLCAVQGKRLCDAHEWEGACAGGIREDYGFTGDAPMSMAALRAARRAWNGARERVYAFQWQAEHAGRTDSRGLCGVYHAADADITVAHDLFNAIGKSRACHTGGSDYRSCGSNTWPAGFKHACVSALGVFDLHGNVAEVVNFPRWPGARGALGGMDRTERKGSFFVYRRRYPDDCRVRQPFEHFNDAATDRHAYYQEGFRCCRDVR